MNNQEHLQAARHSAPQPAPPARDHAQHADDAREYMYMYVCVRVVQDARRTLGRGTSSPPRYASTSELRHHAAPSTVAAAVAAEK